MIGVVLPMMLARGKGGAIINIGSNTSVCPSPYLTVYSACKVSFLPVLQPQFHANSSIRVKIVFSCNTMQNVDYV